MELIRISRKLARAVSVLAFEHPVTHVYNPLVYARSPHEAYLSRYGARPREIVLVGMNPGPYGMAQTGVPFGDVAMVRDWMGIVAPVGKPPLEHPQRPVEGFACKRSEVSGSRLWGWARDRFGTAEQFFERFFVANYCPLAFMEESGRNRTPDKLPRSEQAPLFAACDEALAGTVRALGARFVVGVGAFAMRRAQAALAGLGVTGVTIGTVLHPSPASPKANHGWAQHAEANLRSLGIALPA
jgi:single-strand selective monofunctional uracil DNA glycosylase